MFSATKRLSSLAASTSAFSAVVSLLEKVDCNRNDQLRVLAYHRIDECSSRPELSPRLISASPAAFAAQMQYLSQRYQPVSIHDVLAFYQQGTPLPRRALLITFDDAYCDFAEHAWPVLKRYGLPAVLFVPTAYPDQRDRSFWWDQLHCALQATSCQALNSPIGQLRLATAKQRLAAFFQLSVHIKSLPHASAMECVAEICQDLKVSWRPHHVLGWDDLRKLAGEGVAFGAHTQTHPLMHRITTAQAEREIIGSIEDLAHHIGTPCPVFAYPGGRFNPLVVDAIRRAKLAVAFGTGRGINHMHRADPLRLRRIYVGSGASPAVFRLRLLSRWNYFRSRQLLTGE